MPPSTTPPSRLLLRDGDKWAVNRETVPPGKAWCAGRGREGLGSPGCGGTSSDEGPGGAAGAGSCGGVGRPVFILRWPGKATPLGPVALPRGDGALMLPRWLLLMLKLLASVVVAVVARDPVPVPLLPIPTQASPLPVVEFFFCSSSAAASSSPMLRDAEEDEADRSVRRLLGLPSCRRWKMDGGGRAGGRAVLEPLAVEKGAADGGGAAPLSESWCVLEAYGWVGGRGLGVGVWPWMTYPAHMACAECLPPQRFVLGRRALVCVCQRTKKAPPAAAASDCRVRARLWWVGWVWWMGEKGWGRARGKGQRRSPLALPTARCIAFSPYPPKGIWHAFGHPAP